jgi:hypothetical protein
MMFILSFLGFAVALAISAWAKIRFESLWIKVGFVCLAMLAGLAEFIFAGVVLGLIFTDTFPPREVGRAFLRDWHLIAAGAVIGALIPRGKIIRRKPN